MSRIGIIKSHKLDNILNNSREITLKLLYDLKEKLEKEIIENSNVNSRSYTKKKGKLKEVKKWLNVYCGTTNNQRLERKPRIKTKTLIKTV